VRRKGWIYLMAGTPVARQVQRWGAFHNWMGQRSPTPMLEDCDAELYCAKLMINPTPPQIPKIHN
jgi:hypothetical protein